MCLIERVRDRISNELDWDDKSTVLLIEIEQSRGRDKTHAITADSKQRNR